MIVKLQGSYTFEAPRDDVWAALQDPEVLANTLPGCEKLERTGDNEFVGVMKIRVGPVQGQFQGKVNLGDLNAPESYTMIVDGKGPIGFVKGKGTVRLEDQRQATLMHYEGEAQVGGRIASVGQRLLDSSAKSLTRQALDAVHQQIKARIQPGEVEEAPPSAQAPTELDYALRMAKDVVNDFLPVEKRPQLIGAVLALLTAIIAFRVLESWLVDRLTRRVGDVLQERR
jgi:uncharacterized protein